MGGIRREERQAKPGHKRGGTHTWCCRSGSFQDPDPRLDPGCPRIWIRIINYSNEHNKIDWKGKLNTVCLFLGPVGPTDKENKVKMNKKYCFRFTTSLNQ
jgi:hypothetical protein